MEGYLYDCLELGFTTTVCVVLRAGFNSTCNLLFKYSPWLAIDDLIYLPTRQFGTDWPPMFQSACSDIVIYAALSNEPFYAEAAK
ncbi:predicted protein [Botrytis cinerea T4]|uniref:Uncharacterized protein n=1 Tax=Botryotinia fuckeliana (strain T4) TaxID=999810 RepID=G2Y247_BOTF4|nr:predicted protein [Botrytis cinerea T4]